MKIGDLVTYRQHPDNQVYPCPWSRMGLITAINNSASDDKGFEVYWYGSGKKAVHVENYLELAR